MRNAENRISEVFPGGITIMRVFQIALLSDSKKSSKIIMDAYPMKYMDFGGLEKFLLSL